MSTQSHGEVKRWRFLIRKVNRALLALEAPNKPLWVTETNYNLLNGMIRSKRKVRRYIRKTNKYANQSGVDRIYWYAFGVHTNPKVFGIRLVASSAGYRAIQEFKW